jgi:predicted DNA binding CopG/RHH family protein
VHTLPCGAVTALSINSASLEFIFRFKTRSRWSQVLRSQHNSFVWLSMVAKQKDCAASLHFISRWSLSFRLAEIQNYSITLNDTVMENKKEDATKRGRPAKEKAKLNFSINLKLTEEDFKTVQEKAAKLGMKPTQYAREMVLKGSVKSRFTLEELDKMRKLSGMANNLNQIAKKANISGYPVMALEMVTVVGEIKKALYDR